MGWHNSRLKDSGTLPKQLPFAIVCGLPLGHWLAGRPALVPSLATLSWQRDTAIGAPFVPQGGGG